ncbi:hypothetical protein V8E52_004637 [Russula decolorans]|jgi:hypothetical protein
MDSTMPTDSSASVEDALKSESESGSGALDRRPFSLQDLPRWAHSRTASSLALLVVLLPASLLSHLPTLPDQAELLNTLSSGQFLCVAYKIGVRQSRKPWGYINDDSIHDTV